MKKKIPFILLSMMLAFSMVFVIGSSVALADNSGWKSATSYNDNTTVGSPGNAYVSNNNYANFDWHGDAVDYTFGNNIVPSTAIIKGIQIRLEAHKNRASIARKFEVNLLDSGKSRGEKTTEKMTNEDRIYSLGGTGNTWGYGGWTADKINNHFEVHVRSTAGTLNSYLDHVQLRVTYTLPETTTTITSLNNSSTYGQSVTFTATVSPSAATGTMKFYANGSSIGSAAVSGGSAAITTSSLPAGSYTIKAEYSGSSLYKASSGTCGQTVNKAAATITANDKSKTYGDSDPALNATVTGTVNGETLDYSLSRVSGENAGSYNIIVTLGSGAVNDNYNITTKNGTLTINKKAATITANDKSKTYGESDPALNATVTGAVNGETLDYSLSREPGENAGGYDIIVTLGSGAVNDNYNITTKNGTLTINKKAATITANDKSKIYGESDPALNATVTGAVNGETLDYSLSRNPGENAGDYDIIVTLGSGAVNDNYNITTKNGTLTINKKAATITIDNKNKVYGETDPPLTAVVTGMVGSDTLDYTLIRDPGENAGGYDIIVTLGSGAVNDNYNITTKNGTLTINKKAATITANDKSKIYGESDPALNATVTGAVNGETLDYSLSRNPGENAGDYDIIVTLGSGAVNDNYNITTKNGTLTINKKAATITANDKSKIYGESDPALNATVTGAVNGETLDYSLSRNPGENAGGYDIIVTLGSGAVNDNYNITTKNGTLTINKKAATITIDNKNKVYGETDPPLTAVVTGMVGSDTLDYTLIRDLGENAGTYNITATLGTNPNYSIAVVDGTFTIAKKTLTVTADDKTVIFNDAAPVYTAVLNGFAAGDDAGDLGGTLAFVCPYVSGSPVGTYSITPAGLTSGNYDIAFVPGTLTVNTLYLDVTFEDFDGTQIGAVQVVEWNTAALAPADPEREGYTFTGWDVPFDAITADTTVTAQYEINTFTVTFFEADGITQIGAAQTIDWGNAATFETAPAVTGSAFDEWILTGDDDTIVDSLTNVQENIVAVASYIRNGYTVTFVDYDGQVLGTDGVLYGDPATAPADPEREGYTFAGWDVPFDSITATTTVTAEYDINTYTVTFVDFDGTQIGDVQTVEWNTAATAPEEPEREGFTFTGWSDEFDAVTENLTITAEYEETPVLLEEEDVPEAGDTAALGDEEIPEASAGGFPWWILIAIGGAALLFLIFFFVWKRRKQEEEEAA